MRNTFKVGKLELQYCTDNYNKSYENERGVEVPLGHWFVNNFTNVVEVGCVLPYYFDTQHVVIDLCDTHPKNIQINALDYDYKDKNVISLSTIEHLNSKEYNNGSDQDAITLLHKIIDNAKNWLITFPVTYHAVLDKYLIDHPEIKRTFLRRLDWANNWIQSNDEPECVKQLFGSRDGRHPDGFFNNSNCNFLITNVLDILE